MKKGKGKANLSGKGKGTPHVGAKGQGYPKGKGKTYNVEQWQQAYNQEEEEWMQPHMLANFQPEWNWQAFQQPINTNSVAQEYNQHWQGKGNLEENQDANNHWGLIAMCTTEEPKEEAQKQPTEWKVKAVQPRKQWQKERNEGRRNAQEFSPPRLMRNENRYAAFATEEVEVEEDEWSEEKRKEWNQGKEFEETTTRRWKKRSRAEEAEKEEAQIHCLVEAIEKDGSLNAMEGKGEIVDVVLDSGSSAAVIPRKFIPGYKVNPSKASKAGVKHAVANGDTIANEGETIVALETEEGALKGISFQIAETTRPLLGVAAVARAGHVVVLNNTGGYIFNIHTGQMHRVRKVNDIYVLRVRLLPVATADKLGFARQEA